MLSPSCLSEMVALSIEPKLIPEQQEELYSCRNSLVAQCYPRHAQGDLTSLAPHERLPEILVVLSHQGSPRILEWVAYPCQRIFPQGTSKVSRVA